MMNLTARQREILDFITDYITRHGLAPSVTEIKDRFQLGSLGTVHKHLKALESRGCIRRSKGCARAIEVIRLPSSRICEVPMLGLIAAGSPIEALEIPDSLSIPEDMLGRGQTYSLQVNGDSMIEDGIHDEDFIIVESRSEARNGEIVVAVVDESEATVKRWYREGDRVRLQPSNATMQPIVVSAASVKIRGVVIGLIRKYR
ncbi:transcriptional repressor LexA [bacterium]|nr:transcriptional repressor LexA [candidate division CSSED10-310 bacterium]